LPIALRYQLATSRSRLHERHSQRSVGTHEMTIGSPPLEVGQQVRRLLRRRPGATSQRGYSMSDRQIHPLDKGGVELS
jgi:hypothetical protein